MKVRRLKRCHASFPCQNKKVIRFRNGKNRSKGFYHKLKKPVIVCLDEGTCNQQHNNLAVDFSMKLWKEVLQP